MPIWTTEPRAGRSSPTPSSPTRPTCSRSSATGPLDHTMAVGVDVTREIARLPAQPVRFRRHDDHADQLPQSGSLALRRLAAAADRDPVDLRRGDQYRRLHRRPDQDHQVFRAARARALRPVQLPAGRAAARRSAVAHLERVDKLPSWRVGAVVHPIENTSVYVMRGTSFNPSADNLTISRRQRRRASLLRSDRTERHRPRSAPRPRCSTSG